MRHARRLPAGRGASVARPPKKAAGRNILRRPHVGVVFGATSTTFSRSPGVPSAEHAVPPAPLASVFFWLCEGTRWPGPSEQEAPVLYAPPRWWTSERTGPGPEDYPFLEMQHHPRGAGQVSRPANDLSSADSSLPDSYAVEGMSARLAPHPCSCACSCSSKRLSTRECIHVCVTLAASSTSPV